MPLIRFREKEMRDEVKVFIYGSVENAKTFLNGEEIQVHRGVFYVDSELLIRHLEQVLSDPDLRYLPRERVWQAKIALSWLTEDHSIPDEGLLPFEEVGEAIDAFIGKVIDQKLFDDVECPTCGCSYAPSETRLYYWCEDTFCDQTEGHVHFCGRGHVIRHSLKSFSTAFLDPSAMDDPKYEKTQYTMIEKFAPDTTA